MIKETSGPDQLIYLFSKLPGLGTRSARRIVIHLLQDKDLRLKGLIDGLQDANTKINCCINFSLTFSTFFTNSSSINYCIFNTIIIILFHLI